RASVQPGIKVNLAQQRHPRHLARQWAPTVNCMTRGHWVLTLDLPELDSGHRGQRHQVIWLNTRHRVIWQGHVGSESTGMTAGHWAIRHMDRLTDSGATSGHQASGQFGSNSGHRVIWQAVGSESTGMTAGTGSDMDRLTGQRASGSPGIMLHLAQHAGTASSGKAVAPESTGKTAGNWVSTLDRLTGQRASGPLGIRSIGSTAGTPSSGKALGSESTGTTVGPVQAFGSSGSTAG
ncbi:unnamed protein product, partial [Staurois parvus]